MTVPQVRRYLLTLRAPGWSPSAVANHVRSTLPTATVERAPEASALTGLWHAQVVTPPGTIPALYRWFSRGDITTPGALLHFSEMPQPTPRDCAIAGPGDRTTG